MVPSPEVLRLLNEVRLHDLAAPLGELGVELFEDLRFIKDTDLESLGCNVIQRRRFLAARDRNIATMEIYHATAMSAIGQGGVLGAPLEAAGAGTSVAAMTSAEEHVHAPANTPTKQKNEACHGEDLPTPHGFKKKKQKKKKRKKLDTPESSRGWADHEDEEPAAQHPRHVDLRTLVSSARETVSLLLGPVPERMVSFVPDGMFLWRSVSKDWHTEFGTQAVAYTFFSNEVIFNGLPPCVFYEEPLIDPRTVLVGRKQPVWHSDGTTTGDENYVLNIEDFVRAVADRIPPELSSLRLCFEMCMDDDGLRMLARCLPSHLQELSLSFPEARISSDAVAYLVSHFPQGLHELRLRFFSLDFGYCNNTDNIQPGPEFVVSVSDRVHSGMQHHGLKVNCDLIGELSSLSYLGERLPGSLQSLDLSFDYCEIEGHDVVFLAEHFPMGLQKLQLSFLGGELESEDLQSVIDNLPSSVEEVSLHFPKQCLGTEEDLASSQIESDEDVSESLVDWWYEYVHDALHDDECQALNVQVHYVGTAQHGAREGLHIYAGAKLKPLGAAGLLVNVWAEP